MSADALQRHAGFVRRIARGLLADRDQAEDVYQATLAEALARPPRHAGNLRGWLGTVARRIALRRRAREAQRRSRERRAARPEAVGAADEAVAKMEIVRRIAAAVTALDEPYRTAVIERYYHDRRPADIARRPGVPVATVKTRLRRALAQLRGRLDADNRNWAVLLAPLAWPHGSAVAGVTIMTGRKALAVAVVLAVGALGVAWGVVRGGGGGAAPDGRVHPAAEDACGPRPDAEPRAPVAAAAGGARERYVFAGRVVDGTGAPVARARVELLYAVEAERTPQLLHVLVRRAREERFVPAVATDAAGAFRFERPYASRSFLRARAEDYAPRVSGLHGPGEGIEIVLRRDGALRVRVVDDRGEPVAGASVTLESTPAAGGGPRPPVERAARGSNSASGAGGTRGAGGARAASGTREHPPLHLTAGALRHALDEATTDAKGEARLARPPLPGLGLFVVPAEPHLGPIERRCPDDRDEIEVVVPRLTTHRTRIVDADTGAPVPGARIVAVPDSRPAVGSRRRVVHADADGWVDRPWQEGWRAFTTAPGYEVKFAGGDPVRLRRAMRVDGTVVDPEGRPVAGAPVLVALESGVRARARAGLPLVAAWSDADGRFGFDLRLIRPDTLPFPPDPGVRTLVATDDRFPPAFYDGLRVEPGGRAGVVLRFAEPASLVVTATDAEDAPLADAVVSLARVDPIAATWTGREPSRGRDPRQFGGGLSPRTDAAGRATFANLSPGPYRVHVGRASVEIEVRAGERATVRVRVGAGAAIAGRVLDRDGEPIAGASVSLYGPSSRYATTGYAKTDGDGTFRVADLKPGAYVATVEFARGRVTFDARAGDTVVFREPAGKARLRIVVTGPPPDAVTYSLTTLSGSELPQGDGALVLAAPDYLTQPFWPGRGVVVVRAPGHAWRAFAFEARELETVALACDLPGAGGVKGRVTGLGEGNWLAQVEPLDWEGLDERLWRGAWRGFDGWAWWTGVAADGSFEVRDLSPGRWRVRVGSQPDGPGFVDLVTKVVEVGPGATTSMELEAPR